MVVSILLTKKKKKMETLASEGKKVPLVRACVAPGTGIYISEG